MRLSSRAPWDARPNRLSAALEASRAHGHRILDLTHSNPTTAGIPYPLDEIAEVLARAAREPYRPTPLGLRVAREAVAEDLQCHPDEIAITASTSEAYALLFKILADEGDEIVTATPSYPLLEHLVSLELAVLRTFPLELHRRWEIDPEHLRNAMHTNTRAIVLVHPNNPLGVYATPEEQDSLAALGVPLISDEVFFDYPLDLAAPQRVIRDDVLTFSLGGLSKSCGMPHYKLAWMRMTGPPRSVERARSALDLVADQYLSAATPVQEALPALLRLGHGIRASIHARLRENLGMLRSCAVETIQATILKEPLAISAAGRAGIERSLRTTAAAQLLPVEGGWSAVLRVPAVEPDEALALRLLERGFLVHPGYFFDFATDGYLVISLLTPPDVLAEGLSCLLDVLANRG